MKTTDHFKNTIKAYLDERAKSDELFAERYANEKKNINDCCTYILNTVKASGCNGFADDEIFGMAVHYYQEEDVKVGDQISCKVVVNHTIELTEEEKAEARQKAIDDYQQSIIDDMNKQRKKKAEKRLEAEKEAEVVQGSLF